MTNTMNHPGLMAVPRSRTMAAVLASYGFDASVTVANCNFGGSFGRRLPEVKPDMTRDKIADILAQREAMPDMIRASVREAATALGLEIPDNGIPRLTSVGFYPELHNLPKEDLVQVVGAPGYWNDDNPTRPCLAVVVPPEENLDLDLMMPFADAPPQAIVVPVRMPDGSIRVIKAMTMSTYHFMWGEHEIVRLTARKIEEVARAYGAEIIPDAIWGFTGPGASEHFDFNGRVRNEFRAIDPEAFEAFTTFDPDNQDLFPEGHKRYDPVNGYHQLNLRGLAAYRLQQVTLGGHRIPAHHLGELAHNTKVALGCYTSKRELLGDQNLAASGRRLPSNAMFLVVRKRLVAAG
ncbi:MAG TPA: hypothetical protein VJM32_02615 [Candidatus Saccharimonadales bacterium]|nr:hypothetical protein [Candidatus Saccharimonadales bacterium]